MDIKMLDYVVMIAKCESISKAAEKLYLTQSGLNQQLLKLERNLGIKLFERDHHHFRITDAGKFMCAMQWKSSEYSVIPLCS